MFGIGLLTDDEIVALEQDLKELGGMETANTDKEGIIDVIYDDSFFGSEIGKYG